jgi:hypothetical protein
MRSPHINSWIVGSVLMIITMLILKWPLLALINGAIGVFAAEMFLRPRED